MKILNIEPISFKGRITRKTFWLANALLLLISFALYFGFLLIMLLLPDDSSGNAVVIMNLVVIIMLVLAIFAFWIISLLVYASLIIRRAHDINSSGILWLIGWFLIGLPAFILGLIPGKDKSNQYGSARQ